MPFNDDIHKLADLKWQISQKMILLCAAHRQKCHSASKEYHLV